MSTKTSIQLPQWEFSVPLTQAVQATLNDWQAGNKMARLWRGDPALWTGEDEDKWIGWLSIVEDRLAHLKELNEAAAAGLFERSAPRGLAGNGLAGPHHAAAMHQAGIAVDHGSQSTALNQVANVMDERLVEVAHVEADGSSGFRGGLFHSFGVSDVGIMDTPVILPPGKL